MRRRLASAARLGAWLLAVAAGGAALWVAGAVLPAPPLTLEPSRLTSWWRSSDPAVGAMALVRLTGLAVGFYLAAVSVVGLAVRLCGRPRLVALTDRFTAPGLRRLLDAAMGAVLVAATAGASVPVSADTSTGRPGNAGPVPGMAQRLRRLPEDHGPPVGSPRPVHMRRLPDDRGPPVGPPSTVHVRRLPDDPSPPVGPSPSPPAAAVPVPQGRPPSRPRAAAPVPQVRPPSPPASRYRVQPGDSFWRIAEQVEGRRLGRRPTDAETGRYWQTLVAANRHRVSDPDLIFPGQVFDLP